MSISTTPREAGPFVTDGSTTVFPFEFKVLSGAGVRVIQIEDDVQTVMSTGYVVTLNADQESDPGGIVTISPALNGPAIYLTSRTPIEQPAVFTNTGGFYPRVLNDSLDRLTIIAQETRLSIDGIDGGQIGNLRADLASSVEGFGAALVTTKLPYDGAVARPAILKFADIPAMPEDFGGVLNDGGSDSWAALQACIDETGRLHLRGHYYGSKGLVVPQGTVITGDGPFKSAYFCSHATEHLLSPLAVASNFTDSFRVADLALVRTVNPTTPASAADDRTQGHGINLDLVSNPLIENVFTYNNLVELYLARCLSPKIFNVRGLRQTGTGADRWTGFYLYGDPTGMPGGWAAGPSGNPSALLKQLKMGGLAAVGSSTNYKLARHLQDMWGEDWEAAGGHVEFDIDAEGYPAGDCNIIRPVADGYRTKAFHIRNLPIGSTMKVLDAWVAPAAGATDVGARLESAPGLTFTATGDFTNAPTLDGVYSTDSSQQKISLQFKNCQRPMYGISVNSSTIHVDGTATLDGASAGYIVNLVGGTSNVVSASGVATGTKKWLDGVALDASAANYKIDVTCVLTSLAPAVSGNRFSIAGVGVTTQGDVSGHVVVNPGAGAVL